MAFHLGVIGKVGTLVVARFRSSESFATFETALGNSFHLCLPKRHKLRLQTVHTWSYVGKN
jgi:hypothetical protein